MTKIFELINFGGGEVTSAQLLKKFVEKILLQYQFKKMDKERKEFSFAQDIIGVKNRKEIWALLILS